VVRKRLQVLPPSVLRLRETVVPVEMPGDGWAGVTVPDSVTALPMLMLEEEGLREIVEVPRKTAVSVCAEFIKTE
jgi:hypothetical protein